jgi:hypothetical protein
VRRIGADHDDVGFSPNASVLERIVQDSDVRSTRCGSLHAAHTVGVDDDGHAGRKHCICPRFVSSYTAHNERRLRARCFQTRCQKGGERCLSGASDTQIPDTHHGKRRCRTAKYPAIIKRVSDAYRSRERPGEWRK